MEKGSPMSRPLRIEYANALYHVMNRGAGRKPIFYNDIQRELFLSVLSEAHLQFNIQIFSYCLMTNHYHLLIKTPLPNLSRAMRYINGVYTQRYNRMNCTDGPLFRGRYKAILVDSDIYFLHLSKYIHLNPLEANMIDNLSQYEWSSYRAYIGQSDRQKWLFQTEIYNQLNCTSDHAQKYQFFVEEQELDKKVKQFYSKERLNPVLGGDSFILSLPSLNSSTEIARVDRMINKPTIRKIVENTAFEFNTNSDSIIYHKKGRGNKNIPRKISMYIAHKRYDYHLNEIAAFFELKHYGGVASSTFQIGKELKTTTSNLGV